MSRFRPFEPTAAEYKAFAALSRAVWPEHQVTAEECKHQDEARDSQVLFERFVVEIDGEMVAAGEYGEPWWSMRPGKYHINILVHPDYRRQGFGTALYDYVWTLISERSPVLIVGLTREDQVAGLSFLSKHGFEQVMRTPVSCLDVRSFDPVPFAGTLARVDELGTQILTLAEVAANDEGWKHKLWDLEWKLLLDIPSPEPLTRLSFETWQERALESPGFSPDGIVIALEDGRWVGMSGLWLAPGDPQKLYTGLTGVVRSHRRKGIATAMKVRTFGFAERYGATVIETDNEENNPMYLLNLKLGFEPQPAWLDFEKRIEAG